MGATVATGRLARPDRQGKMGRLARKGPSVRLALTAASRALLARQVVTALMGKMAGPGFKARSDQLARLVLSALWGLLAETVEMHPAQRASPGA